MCKSKVPGVMYHQFVIFEGIGQRSFHTISHNYKVQQVKTKTVVLGEIHLFFLDGLNGNNLPIYPAIICKQIIITQFTKM